MTSDNPGIAPDEPRSREAHVDRATIEVGNAEMWISPGAELATHRLRKALIWSFVVLFITTIGLLIASFLYQTGRVHQIQLNTAAITRDSVTLRQQVLADCAVDRDLAGIPVTPGMNGHPTKLSVRIISDFRLSWHQKSCPGKLPPPDPTFVAGARFYHLPVN